eukprot:TRINITY_DN12256_c0_g1_i5.p1 TRINITY_DN12256_c0_g1~~TRINITY_DN12256_c0_g1_i5.p1  ORF type:complete len:115 (+),score=7.91 TRINITY_DN12256_c0_g1_i5:255-599(+)
MEGVTIKQKQHLPKNIILHTKKQCPPYNFQIFSKNIQKQNFNLPLYKLVQLFHPTSTGQNEHQLHDLQIPIIGVTISVFMGGFVQQHMTYKGMEHRTKKAMANQSIQPQTVIQV